MDLKAGKVPVFFHRDTKGLFGEMKQLDPVLGQVHDRKAVAEVLGLDSAELEADVPVQTISTGLPFAIVPISRLSALRSLRVDFEKVSNYLKSRHDQAIDFYYVTRDTGDPNVRLRARSLDSLGEDPATGSAAGCTAAWMLEHGITRSDETVLIRQGVEIKRPSELFVRASKNSGTIANVRVGGYSVSVMHGEALL